VLPAYSHAPSARNRRFQAEPFRRSPVRPESPRTNSPETRTALTDDVAAKVVEGDTGSSEDPAAKPLVFVQQPEEDVLGLDGARPELAELGASVEEDPERS